LHRLLRLLAGHRQDRLQVGLADHLANGALCHLLHGGVWVPNIEKVFERVLDAPEDDKGDI
jgi:hypothetical protein